MSTIAHYLGVIPSDQIGMARTIKLREPLPTDKKPDKPRRTGNSPQTAISDERVESSNLDRVTYFANAEILYVYFKNGSIYHFYKVPEEVFEKLLDARSHGEYFARNIKGKYPYEQVQ